MMSSRDLSKSRLFRPSRALEVQLNPLTQRGIEVEGLLGVGGTSEVLRVRNAEGERFALKRLLGHFRMSRAHRDALLFEGVHLSLVRSPKVIRCHELLSLPLPEALIQRDLTRDPSAEPESARQEITLLLDLIDGAHLRSLLKSISHGFGRRAEPLQREEVASIVSDLAQGIYALHRARRAADKLCPITHGDLSPTNVMIRQDGVAVIIDLSSATSALTRDHAHPRPGKRAYLSPARLRGELEGPPSDLYALGVIWFELVTQSQPPPNVRIRASALTRAGWPPSWSELVEGLLSPAPVEREEALKHIGKQALWGSRGRSDELKMIARRTLGARVRSLLHARRG